MGACLSCVEANKRNQQKKMSEFAETPRGQKVMNSKKMVKYREKRLEKMQPDVERRLREEEDETKGERVWFSRYILNGRLRHWVIMTHGSKYELRRSDNVTDQQERAGELEFTYHVEPFEIDQERRNAAMAENSLPDVDGFYICLIGWTRKSKGEVDQACRSVFDQFGQYRLLWNNCQHFLKALTDEILIPTPKAADYPWFISNTKTRYQKTQQLMPPPLEFLLRMQALMTAQMQQNVLVQNQLQLQTQNQIQMQIQNQIQTQMQNQMQMQMGGGMGA